MAVKIERVWAYLAVGEDGVEGICLAGSILGALLLVSAAEEGVEALRPHAEQIARKRGAKVTLARFDVRTDVEEILPQ